MSNLIEPNLHPIFVHFAYALTISAVICYLLSSLAFVGRHRDSARKAADWMLGLGAFAILATIAAGLQAYYSVGHDGPSHAAMTTHRNWAIPSGIAVLVLAVWRWLSRDRPAGLLFKTLLTAAAFALSVTAWWGGHIVYNYGLGVKSLPAVSGDGHDHDHGDMDVETADDQENSDEAVSKPITSGHDNTSELADSSVTPLQTPIETVDAFANALKTKDIPLVKALMLPNIVISEGGHVERSFEIYASGHMLSDMLFMANVETSLKNRDVKMGMNTATVISESQMHGSFNGKTVHNLMLETMVLQKVEGGWRISHIHWSSTPIKGEHAH